VSKADLERLLAAGERAAFHGPPTEALGLLSEAIQVATAEGRVLELVGARWLLGVAQQAGGRYASALATLDAAWADGSATPLGPFLATTVAEVHRQLADHDAATVWDQRGLDLAEGEATAWPLLGLAADAIGAGDAAEARRRLEAAVALVGAGDWRLRGRAAWATAELALLEERPADAVEAAVEAVHRAESAAAPQQVAKGLLFQGVALAQAGDPGAIEVLLRAASLSEGLGALPVAWPARAVLGTLQEQAGLAEEAAASFAAARRAVEAIAEDLDASARARWLEQPAVAAVLEVSGAGA
jgi:hypothetical protein